MFIVLIAQVDYRPEVYSTASLEEALDCIVEHSKGAGASILDLETKSEYVYSEDTELIRVSPIEEYCGD